MAVISGSAGWARVCRLLRNNFAASKDTNRFRFFSQNSKLLLLASHALPNGERRRKLGLPESRCFQRKVGHSPSLAACFIHAAELISPKTANSVHLSPGMRQSVKIVWL